MAHLSDLELIAIADDACRDEQQRQHAATCDQCSAKVQALQAENRQLRAALAEPVPVPPAPAIKFPRAMTFGRFAVFNVVTGCAIWSLQFLWKLVFEGLIFEALDWFEVPVPDVYGLTVTLVLFIYEEGATMIDQYLGMILTCLLALGAGMAAYFLRRTRGSMSLLAMAVLSLSILAPQDAAALETRSGDVVRLSADERIDDTLIASGESVLIDGEVAGDVMAFARRVVVKGSVGGNLIAFAQSVTVEGDIGGTILGAADSFELRKATVAGNFAAAAGNILISEDSSVTGNAIVASQIVTMEGSVGQAMTAAAETIELDGAVGRDVNVASAHVLLGDNAIIQGDVRIRTDEEDNLHRAEGATVNGEVSFPGLPEQAQPRNRYLSAGFYFLQVLKLIAALIAGLLLLWLMPGLRNASVDDLADGAKKAGLGLVGLISMPVVALIIGATLVGLPVALIGFALWIALIYFAKIIAAWFFGRLLLSSGDAGGGTERSTAVILLVGLLVVLVATNLPFIGGIVGFVLTILGAGLLINWLWDILPDRQRASTG